MNVEYITTIIYMGTIDVPMTIVGRDEIDCIQKLSCPPESEVGINQSPQVYGELTLLPVYKVRLLVLQTDRLYTQVMRTPVMITTQKYHLGGSYLLRLPTCKSLFFKYLSVAILLHHEHNLPKIVLGYPLGFI